MLGNANSQSIYPVLVQEKRALLNVNYFKFCMWLTHYKPLLEQFLIAQMVQPGALTHRNSCSRTDTAPQERTVDTLRVSWWKHCISSAPLLLHPGEHAVLASSSCAMNGPLPRWNWHLCCSHFVISSEGEWQGRVLLFSHAYEAQIRAHTILCR